jgi:maleate isomerase
MTAVQRFQAPLKWRARVGLVVVSGATVSEGRYPNVAPPDVGFFTSRLLHRGGGMAGLLEMEKHSDRAIEELATANVDSVAYCCTVSGALRGMEGDREFCQEMETKWGVPVASTMLAAVEAMQHLGVRKVVVTSPYPDSHHESERAYLEEAGIHAIKMQGMNLTSAEEYAAVSPQEIYDFSMEAWDDEADALFISCMNFDAMAAAQALEDTLHKPVITSHSVTLWKALALAGVDDSIPGYGRLLEEPRCMALA